MLSNFTGKRRRFIRRVGSLCLIAIGIHAAGDTIDDAVFVALDVIDLRLDALAHFLLGRAADGGLVSNDTATKMGLEFADWINVERKLRLGLWMALASELVILAMLLDFIWGRRDPAMSIAARTRKEEFKTSLDALQSAFKLESINLETLAIIPTCLFFSVAGALWAGRSAEGLVIESFATLAPEFNRSINIAAGIAVLSASTLVLRFVPDLLLGAVRRAAGRRKEKSGAGRWAWRLRAFAKGWILALILLPIATLSLFNERGFLELIARVGTLQ